VPKTFVSECENLHNFIKKTNDAQRTKVIFQTGSDEKAFLRFEKSSANSPKELK
jgi:hypothetical protein